MDRQVVGPVEVVGGVGVLVEQVDGDVVVGGAVSVGVRLDAARGVGVGRCEPPELGTASPQWTIQLVTVSLPGSEIAPRVRLYELPSLTLAAPLMAIVGATLLTWTARSLARSRW